MTISKVQNRAEWEELLQKFNCTTFLQSWEWGNFQKYGLGKNIDRIVLTDNNSEIVGCTLAIEEVTKLGKFLYLPRGPVVYWNSERWPLLVQAITDNYKADNYMHIRIDPALTDSRYLEMYKALGFKRSATLMQVERAWILNLEASSKDQLFQHAREQGMHRKLPGEIRRAKEKGVQISSSRDLDSVEVLINLLHKLGERKEFALRPDQYYRNQFKHLVQGNRARIYIAHYRSEVISAAMIVFDKDEASYLHSASVREHSNLYAPAAMLWDAITDAYEAGCNRFNFWGVGSEKELAQKDHASVGYSRFKKRFGGQVEEYLGTWDLPLKKHLYYPYWMIEWYWKQKSGM